MLIEGKRAIFLGMENGYRLDEVTNLLKKLQAIDDQYPEIKSTLADAMNHLDRMVVVMGIDHFAITGLV
jgi:microsomal dipeptidase-like Zn-dependent dipeptidase